MGCAKMLQTDIAHSQLAQLTDRQREVLDLVVDHKSTKEIALALGIAPNTVDQRILAAREKLGVARRGELARTYAQLKDICGQTTCGSSYVAFDHFNPQTPQTVSDKGSVLTLSDAGIINIPAPWLDGPPTLQGLEALDRRFGILGRVLAIGAICAFITLTFLALVAIATTLSRLI